MTSDDFDVDAFLAQAVPPSVAPSIQAPGIYAILLASPGTLPSLTPGRDGLLYVGMTDATLDARNHFNHAHSGFSTLRRSLGALLMHELELTAIPRAPGNSKSNFRNYRFPDAGERVLSQWMDRHLLIAQTPIASNLVRFEKDLIVHLEPPLNLIGWPNPQRAYLKALRTAFAAEAHRAKT